MAPSSSRWRTWRAKSAESRRRPQRRGKSCWAELLAVFLTLLVAGCPDGGSKPGKAAQEAAKQADRRKTAAQAMTSGQLEMRGKFFSPEALTEDAVVLGDDFEGVPCAGAATHERFNYEHPKMVRGQVVAPSGELASNGVWDLLIPSAHAVPVEGERLVEGATVRIARWTKGGVVALDEPRATTDALGRFCLRLPSHLSPGSAVVVEASSGSTILRRFLYDKADANISVGTEALVHMVTDAYEPSQISRAELVNLHTVAFSELDTITPVSLLADANVGAALETVTNALNDSERVREKFAALAD